MATVIREAAIDAPAVHCWDALSDFFALHQRLAAGFVANTEMMSDRDRQVTFSTGAVAVERLIGTDDDAMRLAYSVVEGPMGAAHHNASAQILPDGPRRCRFVWITDVLPDELGPRTASLMEAGLQAMKSTLERSAAGAGRGVALGCLLVQAVGCLRMPLIGVVRLHTLMAAPSARCESWPSPASPYFVPVAR
jgi:hypothetical protein